MSLIGMTYNLKRFPKDEIEKCVIQMAQKKLDARRAALNYGPELSTLPSYSWSDIKQHVSDGASLIIIDNVVYDVTEFKKTHPGGEKMISIRLGTDCTEAFNGGVYNHGFGARHWLSLLKVGRISDPHNKDKEQTY
jgi:stearoyl-CoA desaturase (delta-9 desaturase)